MSAAFKMIAIVCALSGGLASAGDRNDQGQNQDDQGERGHSYGAPEPVTVLGVALGAGAAGLVAWRARRKRS